MRQRPEGVPGEAFWDESDNEWCLPERNSQGQYHGLVKWWRPDGTLCCVTEYVDGTAHGSYQRFHDNGEVAREGTFVDGMLHGTDRFYRSRAETAEVFPHGLGGAVFSAEMDYDRGRIVGARVYDEDGNPCMEDGSPIPESPPEGLPETAHFRKRESDGEYRWVHGEAIDNGDGTISRVGLWRWWTPEGVLVEEESYEAGEKHGTVRCYDPETGALVSEASYVEGQRHGAAREYDGGELTSEITYVAGEKRGRRTIRLDEGEREGSAVLFERAHCEGDDPVGVIEYLDARGEVLGSIQSGHESGYELMGRVLDAEGGLRGLADELAAERLYGPSIVALSRAVGRGEAQAESLREALARHELPVEGAADRRARHAKMVVSNMIRFGAGPDKCANTCANAIRTGANSLEMLCHCAAVLDDMDCSPIAAELIDATIAAAPTGRAEHFEYTRSLIRASLGDVHGAFASVDALGVVGPDQASALKSYLSALFPPWTFWPATDSRRAAAAQIAGFLERTRPKSTPAVEPFRIAIQKSATRLQCSRERLIARFGKTDWLVPDVSHLLPDGPADVPIDERHGGVGIQHLCRQEWIRLTWLCFFAGLDTTALPDEVRRRDDYVQLQIVAWARAFQVFGFDDARERITRMLAGSDVVTADNREMLSDAAVEAAATSDWFGTKIADASSVLDPDFLHQDELAFLGTLKFFADPSFDLFGEREVEEDEG